ncbi:MAG TPA: copper amine oxidase N-terminal domain-containing protein [Candidatus Cryosericum sp.]
MSRGISTLLVLVLLMCLTLATPGQVCAALSSSLTGTIDVASGKVTVQGKTDAGALVVVNGRQFKAGTTGTFSASFPLAGTATIAVVGKSRPGFSMLLNLPVIPSVAVHVLPAMTFSYDGTSRSLGLAGKLIRKPIGAVKGYVTDTETRGSVSFAVGKDDRFSTTIRLGTGLNTLHSYVRYLLLMRYTLPDFTITVGPVPRTIISLLVGSPRMTVGGTVKAIDVQGTKPLISNGTTMVPIRAIVESLGGSVGWNAAARRLDIRLGSRLVTMWVGKTTATVNGSSKTMTTAPTITGGRTMIPLRFVAENLGCLVGWDQPTKGVTVVYGG